MDLVERVRSALESADLDAMRDLLAPDARWGAPGDPLPPCQNRDQVLSWYRMGRDAGVRARVTEAFATGENGIVMGLSIIGRGDEDSIRWQVLTVRAGQIAAIVGFDDRDAATSYAQSL